MRVQKIHNLLNVCCSSEVGDVVGCGDIQQSNSDIIRRKEPEEILESNADVLNFWNALK